MSKNNLIQFMKQNYNFEFTLLDIGCSDGIDSKWDIFKPNIIGFGIDPVIKEVSRLNNNKNYNNYKYYAYKIGLPDDHPFIEKRTNEVNNENNIENYLWNRLSSSDITKYLNKKDNFNEITGIENNQWNECQLIDLKITIDNFVTNNCIDNIDFIKIDIDGDDISAIISAEKTIEKSLPLGFQLECNWYGSNNETDHVIHNMDKLMRSLGYSLFDILNIRRYSSKYLTDIFDYKYGQTKTGRIYQSDILYLKDPFGINNKLDLSPEKLIKLIMLYEKFDQISWAAEILIRKKPELSLLIDVDKCLDILTNEMHPNFNTYDEYLKVYKTNPEYF
jgi:hypothetical protein